MDRSAQQLTLEVLHNKIITAVESQENQKPTEITPNSEALYFLTEKRQHFSSQLTAHRQRQEHSQNAPEPEGWLAKKLHKFLVPDKKGINSQVKILENQVRDFNLAIDELNEGKYTRAIALVKLEADNLRTQSQDQFNTQSYKTGVMQPTNYIQNEDRVKELDNLANKLAKDQGVEKAFNSAYHKDTTR